MMDVILFLFLASVIKLIADDVEFNRKYITKRSRW